LLHSLPYCPDRPQSFNCHSQRGVETGVSVISFIPQPLPSAGLHGPVVPHHTPSKSICHVTQAACTVQASCWNHEVRYHLSARGIEMLSEEGPGSSDKLDQGCYGLAGSSEMDGIARFHFAALWTTPQIVCTRIKGTTHSFYSHST
jgi:hypothetical protein